MEIGNARWPRYILHTIYMLHAVLSVYDNDITLCTILESRKCMPVPQLHDQSRDRIMHVRNLKIECTHVCDRTCQARSKLHTATCSCAGWECVCQRIATIH